MWDEPKQNGLRTGANSNSNAGGASIFGLGARPVGNPKPLLSPKPLFGILFPPAQTPVPVPVPVPVPTPPIPPQVQVKPVLPGVPIIGHSVGFSIGPLKLGVNTGLEWGGSGMPAGYVANQRTFRGY